MLLQEIKSNKIVSIVCNSWSNHIPKRIGNIRVGEEVIANNGFKGKIIGLGIISNQSFAIVEIPLHYPKAIIHGIRLNEIKN
jgi:hypothetical protein